MERRQTIARTFSTEGRAGEAEVISPDKDNILEGDGENNESFANESERTHSNSSLSSSPSS